MNIEADAIDEHTRALYLEVPGSKVVQLQAYFELYEGLGTVRTLDIRASLVCILTTPTLLQECIAALTAIREDISWRAVKRPPDLTDDRLLGYFRKEHHVKNHS